MRRSILNRRSRQKIKRNLDLPLTSMMDMLIILVVFLLKSYSTSAVAFTSSSAIKLPTSSAEEMPADAVNLIIDATGMTLENEKVVLFKPSAETSVPVTPENATYEFEKHLMADNERRILPLFDGLVKAREKAELIMSKAIWKDKTGNPTKPKFQGVLIIQADKSVRYDLLKKVMYTAGAAEYKVFKLVTVKKDAG